jgi:16S rRNA (uracil1498-N3)-methyltransferase
MPEISPVTPLQAALSAVASASLKLLLWEGERSVSLAAVLPRDRPSQVAFLVGPEGGFEAAEVQAAERAGFTRVGLGPRVLRADTAPVAALAILGYLLGDLGGA